ncbi:hypothetical protein CR105_05250 [Massilia eurypsychrophila]|jgi:hypothetical protein|uniref:Sce7725 family protein n=1 Tax=Massilia eurypsychrophila TaxID=1485217 RepID=A0A2G8TKC9_9BURK|nr:sce7725 family protein [Massilia eurypsychrophila]PIL46474.1 hypothetical protein CR105_05250 [Massilia eurypsychrophila]
MYFPYVYGRQSELLALRSSSSSCLEAGAVVPIVEPIVQKPSGFVKCMETLGKNGQQMIVVINPCQGELQGGAGSEWMKQVDAAIAAYPTVIPGFQCRPGVAMGHIQAFLTRYGDRNIALLYANSGLNDADMQILSSAPNVKFHVVLQGKITGAQLGALPTSKIVHIVDQFNKKIRNADYAGREHFTDSHKTFSQFGTGFGDYTITGSEVQLGGGPPGAVAIHVTYKNSSNGDIWIEHFVSDEVDVLAGSPESKFLEAVAKLAAEHSGREQEFGKNKALAAYFDDHLIGHFPGLGKNKERQILHHIARMNDLLVTGA